MREVYRDRLVRTYRFLRDHPARHIQTGWYGVGPCGTWGCLAGHGVAMTPGWRVARIMDQFHPVSPEGVAMKWRMAGRIVFGLTDAQAAVLFSGANTLGSLRIVLLQILGEDPDEATLPDDVEPETRTEEETAACPAQTSSTAPDPLTVPVQRDSRELVSTAA